MSEIELATPNLPEQYGTGVEGLEDFDTADMVMPTLRINHDETVFEDGLSGEKFPELEVVLLGLIKQRVLWEAEVSEGKQGPLCKSYDFSVGRPDLKRFPWQAAGFAPDQAESLPCASCNLKEWGSHPNRDTPWCSEQHTFALLMPVGDDGMAPALLTVQRSAIKPSKTYLTSFARSQTPLFTVRTKISLDGRRRGTVNFAVPKFVRGAGTDQGDWAWYAEQYRTIRDFVQTPRDGEEDGQTPVAPPAGSAAAPAAPAPAPAPAAAQAAPAPAPAPAPAAAPVDDDDLPF